MRPLRRAARHGRSRVDPQLMDSALRVASGLHEGRSLNDAFVSLDEAQNHSAE